MRSLLVVTEAFEIGGLETHIRGEIISLTRAGCQVHLATGKCFSDLLVPSETASLTTDLPLGPEATFVELIHAVEVFRGIIRQHAIECVHAHPFTSLLPSLIAAELEKVPFVLTLHGPASLGSFYGPIYDFILTSILLPQASLVVTVSQEVSELASPYLAQGKIFTLPNGVDIDAFSTKVTADDTDPRWLLVSRLDPFKIEGIIDFISKAKAAGLAGVLLAGDGPAKKTLISQLEHDDTLDFVEFCGARQDIPQLIQSVTGLAGMGRVVLEGLASRKPVFLVGYDGVKGLVDMQLASLAAYANFSGRNLSTIDNRSFCQQVVKAKTNEVKTLYRMVCSGFVENTQWIKFLRKILELAPQKQTLLGDIYRQMLANHLSDEEVPFLNSQFLLEQLGRLTDSAKYFSPSISASYNHARQIYLEMKHSVALADRDTKLVILSQAMARHEAHIAELKQTIDDYQAQVVKMKRLVADRDAQIAEIRKAVTDRDNQIANLSHALDREHFISDKLFVQLNSVLCSRSWRLTKIPRVIARTIRNKGLAASDRVTLFEKAKHLGRKLPLPMQLKMRIRAYLYQKVFHSSHISYTSEGEGGQKSKKAIASRKHDWNLALKIPHTEREIRPECCALEPGLASIILPVYNQACLLSEAVESVLAQSYQHFELIILNDGSTDNVESVLCKYMNHPKIRIYTQTNQKLPKALSNAFDLARGEYWTWTSADNLMEPRQVELLVKRLCSDPNLGMVYADYYAIDDLGHPLQDPTWRAHNRPDIPSGEIRLPRTTKTLNTIQDNFIGACFMYRGWIGRVFGEYDPIQGIEDYDYWMKINNLFSIEHLGTDDLLYRYRVHDNTLNARAAEEKILEKAQHLMHYEKERSAFYRKKLSLYVDTASSEWLNRLEFENINKHSLSELDQAASKENACIVISAEALRYTPNLLPTIPPLPFAILFNSDLVTPYDVASILRRPGAIAIVGNARDASRVRAVAQIPVIDAIALRVSTAIYAFAKNFLFYQATRNTHLRERTRPFPFIPEHTQKRVLLQADNFMQGGMENVMIDLACTLKTKNIEASILVLGKGGDFVEKAKQAGLEIDVFNGSLDKEGYFSYLSKNKIDVVNAHYSVFGADIAHNLRIPFIQTIHNAYVWLDPDEIEKYRQCDAITSCYTCVSLSVAKYADYVLGLDVSKMHIIPNGIDRSIFSDICPQTERNRLRDEWGVNDSDKVFLNVASIIATKAQLPLAKAFSQIVKRHPGARLVLLGAVMDKLYEKEIRSFLKSSKLEQNVVFTGYDRNVARYYYAADIFVLPSFWEGWSLSFGEALFTGMPIVSTRVGAMQEFENIENILPLSPPFGDVTNLNHLNLAKYVYGNNEDFIARLATALDKAMTLDRIPVNTLFCQQLDRAKAYEAYSELFISAH